MTREQLTQWAGNERMAFWIAEHLPYREMIESALAAKVIELMVAAKERQNGPTRLEYLGGERRDNKRSIRGTDPRMSCGNGQAIYQSLA
jgi:hypothetical protein